MDIKAQAVSGSLWGLIEKFLVQIVQFVVGIVLARLLGPESFGLIAMTSIFIVISGAIADAGFEKAIIQKQDLDRVQLSTAFYIIISLGALMGLTVWLIAPLAADFFREPGLSDVLRVLAFGLPIEAFGQIQRTLLLKNLNFKKVSLAQIASSIVSAIVGISLAFTGYGVWALVASSLSGTITWVLIYWVKSSWYPDFKFSYASIAPIVPYGMSILGSSIVLFILQQFNNLIVGRFYTKTELGLFNRGLKLPETVVTIIQSVIMKISFPVLAKLQEDDEQTHEFLVKTQQTLAFFSFPLIAFLFVNAKEITILLLTDKWIGSVIFMKIFCIAKLFDLMTSLQRQLILVKGKAKFIFKIVLACSLLEVVPIIIFIKYGVIYVAIITAIGKLIQFVIYNYFATSLLELKFFSILKGLIPYIFLLITTSSCLYVFQFFIHTNEGLMRQICFILGSFLVGAVAHLTLGKLFRVDEIKYLEYIKNNGLKKAGL